MAYNTPPNGVFVATASGVQSWTPIGTNTYTNTTYTFALTDQDCYIRFSNGSAQTVTVPTNASVAFPIGTEINGLQAGAGQVSFAAAGGVTLNAKGALTFITGQYGGFSLKKVGTNEWDLIAG
jgi:hypothetical protein